MFRDDASKKDIPGWNVLVDILEQVESKIKDILFAAPEIKAEAKAPLEERVQTAFASGQNLYVFDFFELARGVLALAGERMRTVFLSKVGEHLDTWSPQPSHRQAWKKLLESI
ncbi:MAG: hypothetical protein FJ398_21490 [Verrucomicrobia bacterium]|nr:hypothetical protein [Verrucomicrobiota bacterium]